MINSIYVIGNKKVKKLNVKSLEKLLSQGVCVMKKENIYKLLYAICMILIIGFLVRLGADYFKYDSINNSAPFYAFIITRIVEFIIPSIIIFFVGKEIKKKYSK